MGGTLRSARVFAVPIQTKVPSPNSWGELFFYKELSALPKPSFPALDCQDTSSWNVRTTELINPRGVCLCACVCVLSGCRDVGVSGCRGVGVSGCRGSGVSGCRETRKTWSSPFWVGWRPVVHGTPTNAEWQSARNE